MIMHKITYIVQYKLFIAQNGTGYYQKATGRTATKINRKVYSKG